MYVRDGRERDVVEEGEKRVGGVVNNKGGRGRRGK